MNFDLKEEIGENQAVILIVPNHKYQEIMLQVSQQLDKNYKSICYVSLNKLYSALTDSLQDKINLSKFFFVDGVTLEATPEAEEPKNAVFIPSTSALTDLGITLSKILETGKFQSLFFDSLSTLLIYNQEGVVTAFIRDLMGKVRETGCVAIFTALEGDTESALLKDLGMFVDKVIHLEG